MGAWISGRNYAWRGCGAVLMAWWHCYWYRGLMDGGGGGRARGEGCC